ncbi:unnamed protein product [Orchesella dallaii]|uniref:Reverse transcriptase RNase H-like domain-containing protein n=1 Tax=Orchesella dallaii TaxID=48710 RepID=A0ABP1QW03_9HEXA
MKPLIIAIIAVGATIVALFLIWLIYYSIKTIDYHSRKYEEESDKIKTPEATTVVSPSVTQTSLRLPKANTDNLNPIPPVVSTNKIETNNRATTINNLQQEATFEIINERVDESKVFNKAEFPKPSLVCSTSSATIITDLEVHNEHKSLPLHSIPKSEATKPTTEQAVKRLGEQKAEEIKSIRETISFLQHFHNNYDNSPSKIRSYFKETQTLILRPSYRSYVVDTERSKSNLIIAVDARPTVQAGYCVNLKEKWLQYYVIKCTDFPWMLHDRNDTTEFEMKNVIFALAIWYEEIIRNKSFQIFTDNNAIKRSTKYGTRTQQLLSHFEKCVGVKVSNKSGIHINRKENIQSFALFIKPADDFSRWKIVDAVNFLCNMYQIGKDNVTGTHYMQRPPSRNRNAWYNPTYFYSQVLQKAQRQIHLLGSDCSNPVCYKILWASLRDQQYNRNRGRLYS